MTTKQRQWQLFYLGYYAGKIDGIWGVKSKAATKKFKSAYGLTANHTFDAKAEAKSIEIIRAIQKVVGAIADGLAGPVTISKTITYQKKNALTPDGIAGKNTRAKIFGKDNNVPSKESDDWWKGIKHFKKEEFRCPCGKCGGFPVEPKKELVQAVDDMRSEFGTAVIVVPPDGHSGGSGVRCQRYNDSLPGSVPNSRHTKGKAADFKAPGKSASTIEAYLTKAQRNGKIRYWYKICSGSYHMDVE